MKHTNRSLGDVESNASNEAYLTNTTIRSLSWRCIEVEKSSWKTHARPTPILSKIDGYAEAGMFSQNWETIFTLNWIRDTYCPNGAFRQRQDYAAERTCS